MANEASIRVRIAKNQAKVKGVLDALARALAHISPDDPTAQDRALRSAADSYFESIQRGIRGQAALPGARLPLGRQGMDELLPQVMALLQLPREEAEPQLVALRYKTVYGKELPGQAEAGRED